MPDESTPRDWQDLHAIGLFLACFCGEPVSLQEVSGILPDWPDHLHCEPELAAEQLIAQGLLGAVESAEGEPLLLQCTQRGKIRSKVYLEYGAPRLTQQQELPHASWRKAVMWLIAAGAGGILGNKADEILTILAEELLAPAPSELSSRLPIEAELVRIPAGPFRMGTSDMQIRELRQRFDWARIFTFSNEQPPHRVRLRAFEIGRYPVTNLQYAAFVQDTGHDAPYDWTNDRHPTGREDHPVCTASWHDAQAYVAWLRKRTGRPYRLPTEAEWEKAARSTDGRFWPWGNHPPDPNLCNFGDPDGGTSPVGRYSPKGDSLYGCADMAGNVWEWCSTEYRDYPYDAGDGREGSRETDHHILRGGAWYSIADQVRCGFRYWAPPVDRWEENVGFRVARGLLE